MSEEQEIHEEASAETQAPEAPQTGPSLEEQVASLKDQHLRALAEVENIRRRAQKEREETSKFAITSFARDMLTVADNFRRALEAIPAKHAEDEAFKNLIVGVEATERQLLASFERYGIKPMAPQGQLFNPNFHRAMAEIEDPSHPAGTIVQVLQPGYMIHDRLLREALVAVSKGAPAVHHIDETA